MHDDIVGHRGPAQRSVGIKSRMHLLGKGSVPSVRHRGAHHRQAPTPVVVSFAASTSGRHASVESAIIQQGCTHHYELPRRQNQRRCSHIAAAKRKAVEEPVAPQDAAQGAEADEEVKAGSTRTPRDQKLVGPEVLERGGPEHPYPGEFQQTLITSFTLGGVGLHTGEHAYVRIRPAFAGEGRYFVRVPPGTNAELMESTPTIPVELEEGGQMDIDPELEEKKVGLFKEFLIAQEDGGFTGTFKQFLHEVDSEDLLEKWEAGGNPQADEWTWAEPESIQGRADGEGLLASIDNCTIPAAVTVTLGRLSSMEDSVVGVELLLAALEATGVDNARIEIEGGMEVPQLDGSALGFAMEVQFAGLRPAPRADGVEGFIKREAMRYQGEPFTVRQGDAHITFVPEDNMRITSGVDHHMVAESIGKQWKSWSIFEDLPFRFDLGPARRWLPAVQHLQIMSSFGFFKGGTQGTLMIAVDDSWLEPNLIRFVHDEAARHEVCITLGVLALNARPGHAGLPFGHITTYKATPQLRLDFVRELRRRVSSQDWTPVWDVPLNVNPDADQVLEMMEFNDAQIQAIVDEEYGQEEGEYEEGEEEWEEEGEEAGQGEEGVAEEGEEGEEGGAAIDV